MVPYPFRSIRSTNLSGFVTKSPGVPSMVNMFAALMLPLLAQDAQLAAQDEPLLTEEFRLEVEGAEPIHQVIA